MARIDVLRHVRIERAGRLRIVGEMLLDEGRRVVRLEGKLAGHHLIEHAAHRIDVGAAVDLLASGLLGRDVVERAEDGVRRRDGVEVFDEGDAEVGDLDVALLVAVLVPAFLGIGDEHVARLHVAVHDAVLMRVIEGFGGGDEDLQRGLQGEAAEPFEQQVEALAFDVLEDQVVDLFLLIDVVDAADVGMVETGGGLRLADEAVFGFRVVDELLPQNLDGDGTLEHGVMTFVHDAHATPPQLLQDVVPPDLRLKHIAAEISMR